MPWVLRPLLTSHGKLYSADFDFFPLFSCVRETSSDKGINFPSYVCSIYTNRSE